MGAQVLRDPACRAQDAPSAPFLPLLPAASRPGKYDDHWRYDPRFTGSFDDDREPHRDAYGEDADRRSVHSEHSARSLRSAPSVQSRRSSFSTHSQQVGAGPPSPPSPGSGRDLKPGRSAWRPDPTCGLCVFEESGLQKSQRDSRSL